MNNMDNSLKSLIDSSQSILILLPTRPYFDQVAAGLSLYLSFKGDKQVAISSPAEMLVEFNRLVGVNKITTELGNKNLVIKFKNYKASGIERVSYDIENGEFKLSVIPKPGVIPPNKDQISAGYAGLSADAVILVGGANSSHFPALGTKDLAGVKIIHVGTKAISLDNRENVISFARPASCASELAATLLQENGYQIDADTATNIIMGIEEGSNSFTSQGTTAETFDIFAKMLRAGGQRKPKDVVGQQPFGKKEEPPLPQEEGGQDEPPKDWTGPKIYKGTTVS